MKNTRIYHDMSLDEINYRIKLLNDIKLKIIEETIKDKYLGFKISERKEKKGLDGETVYKYLQASCYCNGKTYNVRGKSKAEIIDKVKELVDNTPCLKFSVSKKRVKLI